MILTGPEVTVGEMADFHGRQDRQKDA